MSGSPRFWDRMAARYAKSPIRNEAAYQEKLRITREYFSADSQVMEFGCGTGTTAISHAPFVEHILATDFSSKMLDIARGKAEAAGISNIAFECTSIDELATDNQSFDVIMGHSILHLVEDRDAVITKVHGLLKTGGYFISSTVCLDENLPILKYVLPIGRLVGLVPLVRFFTGQQLIESVRQAGFEIAHQWQPAKGSVFIVAKRI